MTHLKPDTTARSATVPVITTVYEAQQNKLIFVTASYTYIPNATKNYHNYT